MKELVEMSLETDRLNLVRIKGETHGAEINRVICDTIESLEPWVPWCYKKPSVEETTDKVRLTSDNHENYFFGIYLVGETDPELIGTILLVMKAKDKTCYEIGYWLHQTHCSKGFITECVHRLIKFARDEMKIERIAMYVHDGNEGSLRVAAKTGFRFVRYEDFTYKLRPDWGTRVNHYLELEL